MLRLPVADGSHHRFVDVLGILREWKAFHREIAPCRDLTGFLEPGINIAGVRAGEDRPELCQQEQGTALAADELSREPGIVTAAIVTDRTETLWHGDHSTYWNFQFPAICRL
jgi:hypothetical protein